MKSLTNEHEQGRVRVRSVRLQPYVDLSNIGCLQNTNPDLHCQIICYRNHKTLNKMPNRNHNDDDDDNGLLWKLPVVYSNKLGKLGPAFGLGAGCGVGFGVGMIGGLVSY
ncbi:hypothetical protein Hanom_Chr07g00597021 [Helianthus anomalus]